MRLWEFSESGPSSCRMLSANSACQPSCPLQHWRHLQQSPLMTRQCTASGIRVASEPMGKALAFRFPAPGRTAAVPESLQKC